MEISNRNEPAGDGAGGEANPLGHHVEEASTAAGGLPIAPSMGPALAAMHLPSERLPVDRRVALLCCLAAGIAIAAALFTIGGACGALLGAAAAHAFPGAGVSVSVAALVGMAAIFAGSARALLASVVFAFETTLQPPGLLPLLGGCAGAFLVSSLLMRNTIMTEKIARRGVRVPAEYAADFLDSVLVRQMMSAAVVSLRGGQTVAEVRNWIGTRAAGTAHQGYPVLDGDGLLLGVLTRRSLLDGDGPTDRPIRELLTRPPIVVYDDLSLRAAADHMVRHDVGRLPVVSRAGQRGVVGFITRGDVLRAHRIRLGVER